MGTDNLPENSPHCSTNNAILHPYGFILAIDLRENVTKIAYLEWARRTQDGTGPRLT